MPLLTEIKRELELPHHPKSVTAALLRRAAEEIERLEKILKRVDEVCPLADDTCVEPGITFTEAIAREQALQSNGEEK